MQLIIKISLQKVSAYTGPAGFVASIPRQWLMQNDCSAPCPKVDVCLPFILASHRHGYGEFSPKIRLFFSENENIILKRNFQKLGLKSV